MLWPAPSVSDSRFIDTPLAWPVTTTWKASNSFFAAAIFAAAVAPAGACAPGRIFCAAGATQTWAADAEPAASKATNRGSDFTAEPPWLAASRNGGGFSVPVGELRRLAAYCTAEVRRRAQTSAFIGKEGTCGDVLLQGGTYAASRAESIAIVHGTAFYW